MDAGDIIVMNMSDAGTTTATGRAIYLPDENYT
jgi:hypothetical protein